jgi:sensor c-di-GMP phosphodiesterase-like protein
LTRYRNRFVLAALLAGAVCLGWLTAALVHRECGVPAVYASSRSVLCGLYNHRENNGHRGPSGGALGLGLTFLFQRQRTLARRLRRALRKGELTVVYQPVVDLNTRAIAGAEALARWTTESNGTISPGIFVEAAEGDGFVGELTRFILHRVVDEFDDVLRRGNFAVTVNITIQDLNNPEFFEVLSQCVRAANIKPSTIGFDLAEQSTADRVAAIQAIARLKSAGHKVYIDDFGTGFSSLSYLQRLAADGIKIDRSFSSAIGTRAVEASVVPQLLDMANQLNLSVVVEGIETEEQLAYFRQTREGILGQGWLLGAPVPAAQFKKQYGAGLTQSASASSTKTREAQTIPPALRN